MITAVLTLFAAFVTAGLVIMLVAARRAPVGFEDADGFHAVEEPARTHAMLAATIRVH